jgi:imidazolonepropionase-like amidohydrolase
MTNQVSGGQWSVEKNPGRSRGAAVGILLLCSVLLLSLPSFAQTRTAQTQAAPQIVALKGGRLLTVTHGVIPNGVVVMQNGRITAVGPAGTAIPAGAKVIDCTGMTVYPGLIDAESHLGLTEISAEEMTNDLVETSDEIMPHMHVYDAFHAETELIPVARLNGITNAVVAPAPGDSVAGQDSFIQLAGDNRDQMIMVRDVALAMNLSGNQRRTGQGGGGGGGGGQGGLRFPSTRMGLATQLRQALLDAQDYARRLSDFEHGRQSGGSTGEGARTSAKPSGASEGSSGDNAQASGAQGRGGAAGSFKRDLKMEALLPYLRGERPVVLAAHQADEVLTAMDVAREFHLKVILNHVERAENLLDTIASYKVPVIVGPIWAEPGDEQRYDALFTLPAELAKRGVKIAFASYEAHNARNLPYAAGYAVAYGLPYDEALKAVTLNTAEMFGVADKLGSLDVSKLANVVVANGDPLDVKTDVVHVFIGGAEIPLVSRQTQLRDRYWPK